MKKIVSIFLVFSSMCVHAGGPDGLRKVVDLEGYWKFSIGDNPRWSDPQFNDFNWEQIYVPAPWEEEGFNGFDGYAWYRITVDLRNISVENLYLVLGYIDDVDEVYINGELIGFTGSFPPRFYTAYQSFRQYYIPPELIDRNGKNVIAVRVYDTVHEGGIIKGDIGLYTGRGRSEAALMLEGLWKFREGDRSQWKVEDFDDSNWNHAMVPSFWRNYKHLKFNEGTAWYRKEFELPESLKNEEELVVILGLIDDFDKTYLNGTLIGYTNDGLPLGPSRSYSEYRIYVLPNTILRRNGKNTLAVRVRDLGGNAGIYEGPIAIVPLDEFRSFLR